MDANTLAWLDGLYSRSFSGDGDALTELAKGWGFHEYLVPPEESVVSRASSTVEFLLSKLGGSAIPNTQTTANGVQTSLVTLL